MKDPQGRRWIGMVLGLLLFSVGTQAVLITLAIRNPSFAVVPDYEERARNWNAVQQQEARNQELGWTIDLGVESLPAAGTARVDLEIYDMYGKPIRGADVSVHAFHLARAADGIDTRPVQVADGLYSQSLLLQPAGLWEFQIVVDLGGKHFTQTVRKTLARGGL